MTNSRLDDAPIVVLKSSLEAIARELLEAAGATSGNAAIVVEHLLTADAMGLISHGTIRLPQYLDDIAGGGIIPSAEPVIALEATARATVDGRRGFGQVVGVRMAEEVVRLARGHGIGMAVGRHMGHTGRIGAYAEAIADAGAIGMVVCSGPRSGHWVAPFGGLAGRLATNPIAFAYPTADGAPVVADFSTSVVPEGVIRSLRHRGLAAPQGALRDSAGRPTDDPTALYADPPGFLQPLGGEFGYRGTALALFVEVLATLLARENTDDPARQGSNLAMLAFEADPEFAERARRMGAYVRATPSIDSGQPVMLPGEREQRRRAARDPSLAVVDRPTWTALAAAARGRFAMPEPLTP